MREKSNAKSIVQSSDLRERSMPSAHTNNRTPYGIASTSTLPPRTSTQEQPTPHTATRPRDSVP